MRAKYFLAGVLVWAMATVLQAAPPQIEIVVAKGKSTKLSGTDYDNKSQQFQCNVTIRNKEFKRSFENLKATLVVVGKQVSTDVREVLDKKTSEFSLPLKGEHYFEGSPVALDFDDNAYAQYGTKYEGFVVVIEDSGGQQVISKATKASYLKYFDKLREMSVGTRFNDKFAALGATR